MDLGDLEVFEADWMETLFAVRCLKLRRFIHLVVLAIFNLMTFANLRLLMGSFMNAFRKLSSVNDFVV